MRCEENGGRHPEGN